MNSTKGLELLVVQVSVTGVCVQTSYSKVLVQIEATRRSIQLLLSYQMEHNDLYGQPRAQLHQFALQKKSNALGYVPVFKTSHYKLAARFKIQRNVGPKQIIFPKSKLTGLSQTNPSPCVQLLQNKHILLPRRPQPKLEIVSWHRLHLVQVHLFARNHLWWNIPKKKKRIDTNWDSEMRLKCYYKKFFHRDMITSVCGLFSKWQVH